MTVLVLGAGVIGLSTAYALQQAGAHVHVVDRLPGAGLATSFGNAGGLCPGFAGPWAAPGMVRKAIGWMLQSSAPLKIRPKLDAQQWRWLLQFARECDGERSKANKLAMQAIAHYSQDQLQSLVAKTGIVFDHGAGGVLQTFRSAQTLAAGQRSADVLSELGVEHRLLDREEISQIEPVFSRTKGEVLGALHLPNDQTGDAHLFCKAMARWLAHQGVVFTFDASVEKLVFEGSRFVGLQTDSSLIEGSECVVAAGPFAVSLLRPLGLSLPIYPVKGYSLTYQLDEEQMAVRSSVMDEDSKLMFTRLGSRLRVGGVAEVAGFDDRLHAPQLDAIDRQSKALFPDLKQASQPTAWHGFRPMTPDGRARIGALKSRNNVWINLGHGSNGWTQAAGAGQVLADLMTGRAPAIDPTPYRPAA